LALCVVFSFNGAIIIRNETKSDDFGYLIKYFNRNFVKEPSDFKSVSYAFDKNAEFVKFKGDIALISEGQLGIYNLAGKPLYQRAMSSSKKQLISGDTYLIAYETGRTDYTVYNTFGEIYAGKTQHPIYSIQMGRNGTFAVVTYSDGYICEVYFYNKSFENIYYWKSVSKLVCNIEFSKSGKEFLMTCTTSENTLYKSTVEYRSFNKDEPKRVFEIDDEFVSFAMFGDGGKIIATTDKNTYFLYSDGDIDEKYLHGGIFDAKYSFDGLFVTLVRRSSSSDEYILSAYSDGGSHKFSKSIDYKIIRMFSSGRHLYALCADNTLKKISKSSGEVMSEYKTASYAQDMLYFDGYFVVFYKTGTAIIKQSDI